MATANINYNNTLEYCSFLTGVVNEMLVKSGRPAWDGIVPPRDQYHEYIKKYRLGGGAPSAGPSAPKTPPSPPTAPHASDSHPDGGDVSVHDPKPSRAYEEVNARITQCCGVTDDSSDACFRFSLFVCAELHTAHTHCPFEGEHDLDDQHDLDDDTGEAYMIEKAWDVVENIWKDAGLSTEIVSATNRKVLTGQSESKAQQLALDLVVASAVACHRSGMKIVAENLVDAVGVMIKKAGKEAAP